MFIRTFHVIFWTKINNMLFFFGHFFRSNSLQKNVMEKEYSLGTRRVQKARYSYIIALPMSWAKNNEIKQGSIVAFSLDSQRNLVMKLCQK